MDPPNFESKNSEQNNQDPEAESLIEMNAEI